MTGIHETAYPRLKGDYSEHDLAAIYAPTEEEWLFVRTHYRQANQRAFVLVQLKLLQRLGYFVPLSSLPGVLVKYICNCVGLKTPNKAELAKYDQSGSKTLHHQQLRALVGIRDFAADGEHRLADQAVQVAQTKQELPDIINVLVESLIQQRYELPGFSYLFRLARKSRVFVNGQIYRRVYQQLSPILVARLDRLLENKPGQSQSAWDSLKQEPKQPNVRAMTQYLQHIISMMELAEDLPNLGGIAIAKRNQMVWEARALDLAQLRQLKPLKRYTLMVLLIQAQLKNAMDDIAESFIKIIRNLHNAAEERLKQYHLEAGSTEIPRRVGRPGLRSQCR